MPRLRRPASAKLLAIGPRAWPQVAMAQVRNAYYPLSTEIAPHETAEETQLYPVVNRPLGGNDPTAPMSRGHAEIAHQIARLGRLLNDIGDRDPDEADLADLRGMLYGLEAILRLHTAQEDETYLSLGDTADELSLSAGAS
jgi:Hemerythrin HHE cation binding domain